MKSHTAQTQTQRKPSVGFSVNEKWIEKATEPLKTARKRAQIRRKLKLTLRKQSQRLGNVIVKIGHNIRHIAD